MYLSPNWHILVEPGFYATVAAIVGVVTFIKWLSKK